MRLVLDEMYPRKLAEDLCRRGHDVAAVSERQELRGSQDEELLLAAAAERRALVTENVTDFPGIAASLTAEGMRHYGVLLVPGTTFQRTERGLGMLVRALDAYLRAHPGETDLVDRTDWLARP